MDIPRHKTRRKSLLIGAGISLPLMVILGAGLGGTKKGCPLVDRQTLLIDSVKRGPMVFQVRGPGVLVPMDVRLVTAQVPCKVERILLHPGTVLNEDSVIAELSSPELHQSAQDALWQLRQAEAEFEIQRLNQGMAMASAHTGVQEARASLTAAERLRREGLLSELDLLKASTRAKEAEGRVMAEEARMRLFGQRPGQAAPAAARLEQARSLYALKREQLASLRVRAGMSGVLQQLPIQVGQQLPAGAPLAKVAKSLPLKAEIKISETQAKDLQVGQAAQVDTRNGMARGRVIRIDPSVQGGTVLVDLSLEGDLPSGLRPDLSVEGVVELDRAADTLFVGRPIHASAHGSVTLFRIAPNDREASRMTVRLGRGSLNTIEILEGLREGEKIILSDASAWDGIDRIRLK